MPLLLARFIDQWTWGTTAFLLISLPTSGVQIRAPEKG
jgi:hypothetical protein